MKDRFYVRELLICPFNKIGNSYRPDCNYPRRMCVIDKYNNIAIDIESCLKYDYIEIINGKYVKNNTRTKIHDGKRSAIFASTEFKIETEMMPKISNIIKKLEVGVNFVDGNEALTNEEYLEEVNNEKNTNIKCKKKVIFDKKGK